MDKIFVDTAAWIALLNTSDTLHQSAFQVMNQLKQQKVFLLTTEFVLLEVADALCAPNVRAKTITFVNGLRQLNILEIIPISQTLLNNGWQLYSQRLDKEWSLTDCISFVVMMQEQISTAFTSDHHFQQAGFIKLL
ncbi:PIN domain-containing protein [Gloeocapsopsis sp. IPPAS B-1203]|uniref:type II toxin-antitoxin system VapC family toxin n=1 Tax=Gloeocapsopsis sp. IPPAS B-1203 TaxID=2049454 RepID=UPI000C1A0BA8|nr:PIN domain-containing protein [Gloeocapsopsis sp. IPPAS B-1203]PIG95464.1 PIN domain-containing protein [Gloeocapsopsis sp. IPPAS B-1203]